jgi:hypothetical protein
MGAEPLIHPVYLPVTTSQLRQHFAPVSTRTPDQLNRHLAYYLDSAKRYSDFCAIYPNRDGYPVSFSKKPCQIEKDERFWTAACWLVLFYHPERMTILPRVMACCFGDKPPIEGFSNWEECFSGPLHLFFEARLPSPSVYQKWLAEHLRERNLIPHVLSATARGGDSFEGPTHVDVILVMEVRLNLGYLIAGFTVTLR